MRAKTFGGRDLMIVASFAKSPATGHYDNRLAFFERRNDRSHSSVGDDNGRFPNGPVELVRVEELRKIYVSRTKRRISDLGKNVGSSMRQGPVVDRTNQSIEGFL
jgi:hypothetical protein